VDVEGTFLDACARARAKNTPHEVLRALLNELCLATQARIAILMQRDPKGIAEPVAVGLEESDPSALALLEQSESSPSMTCLTVSLSQGAGNGGALLLLDKAFGQDFTDDDERLADLFAAQLALGADFARRLDAMGQRLCFLGAMVERSPDPMMLFDRVNHIQWANVAAQRRFRQHAFTPPPYGRFPTEAVPFHPDGRPFTEEERPVARALKGEMVENVEAEVHFPDGTTLPVVCNAAPAYDDSGALIGAILTFRDISAERDLERLRAEFAAIMVHDLRNPLSALALSAQNLLREPQGAEVRAPIDVVRRIDRLARRLAVMVSELLDASRIELKRLPLDAKDIDLTSAVSDLVHDIAPALGAHPIVLEVRTRPRPVRVDPARFNQILTNLLENSAKYARDGTPIGVLIAESNGGATVSVSDEGPGIQPDDMPRLFDRFFQAQRARERRQGGLGLGLYITRGLVEASGGHIDARSVAGQGTTFEVWLPEAA
jgi:nitrogen-specific signal transduction histidine kinase